MGDDQVKRIVARLSPEQRQIMRQALLETYQVGTQQGAMVMQSLQTALDDASEALRQLEVLGPDNGVIWLHLRPGKGLVSIRLDDPAMVEAYLDWWQRVQRVRAILAGYAEDKAKAQPNL